MNIKKDSKEQSNSDAGIKKKDDYKNFFLGDMKVTMCFSDDGRTIEQQLHRYILAIKGL